MPRTMREQFCAVQGLRVDRVVPRGRVRDDDGIVVDSDLESGFAHIGPLFRYDPNQSTFVAKKQITLA